jgi:dTDP-D-glucose 4,6-dehydratase
VQNRVPKIDNTMQELGWAPKSTFDEALRKIFEAYRGHVGEARALVEQQ